MAGSLDKFFLSLGVKGQDVVLKTIDNVKKNARGLSKVKASIDLGKSNISKAVSSGNAVPSMDKLSGKSSEPEKEKSNNELIKAGKKMGGAADKFAHAAATLDPAALVHSIAATLPFLGAVAAAGAGALASAKSSTFAAYDLSKRDEATKFYGGERDGTKGINQGTMSYAERSQMTQAIAGSMGKLQQPLLNEINRLSGKKDISALTSAASGDWQSTGTDKGWMLQKVMDGMGDLPPSIKQKFASSMLSQNSNLIQDSTADQRAKQGAAAYYKNSEEDKTKELAGVAAKNAASLYKLNDALNDFQVTLVKAAGGMVKAIDQIQSQINNPKKGPGFFSSVFK
jgi:hypothetical protein